MPQRGGGEKTKGSFVATIGRNRIKAPIQRIFSSFHFWIDMRYRGTSQYRSGIERCHRQPLSKLDVTVALSEGLDMTALTKQAVTGDLFAFDPRHA